MEALAWKHPTFPSARALKLSSLEHHFNNTLLGTTNNTSRTRAPCKFLHAASSLQATYIPSYTPQPGL